MTGLIIKIAAWLAANPWAAPLLELAGRLINAMLGLAFIQCPRCKSISMKAGGIIRKSQTLTCRACHKSFRVDLKCQPTHPSEP